MLQSIGTRLRIVSTFSSALTSSALLRRSFLNAGYCQARLLHDKLSADRPCTFSPPRPWSAKTRPTLTSKTSSKGGGQLFCCVTVTAMASLDRDVLPDTYVVLVVWMYHKLTQRLEG